MESVAEHKRLLSRVKEPYGDQRDSRVLPPAVANRKTLPVSHDCVHSDFRGTSNWAIYPRHVPVQRAQLSRVKVRTLLEPRTRIISLKNRPGASSANVE